MPRTKRLKKTRQIISKQSGENTFDPNIVIKQEPEDFPSDEDVMETDVEPDKKNLLSTQVCSIEQIEKVVSDMKKKTCSWFAEGLEKMHSDINVLKLQIPPEYKDVTLADLIFKEGLTTAVSNDSLSISQRIDASSSAGTTVAQKNGIEQEGTSSTGHTKGLLTTGEAFKTPAVGVPTPRIGTITPKVGPDSPITILRRPKLGEVVVSMKGSPVMLNAAREDKPTLNIPMNNGTVMSILPEKGLRTAHIPQEINEETRIHLKTIWENLGDLIVQTKTPKP